MSKCFTDPTIDELLDDSLTQGLMKADGVDANALKTMLRNLATTIQTRPAVQHDRYIPAGANWAKAAPARGGMLLLAAPTPAIQIGASHEAMAGCSNC